MNRFIISSDTTCDLPNEYVVANNIDIHPLYYNFDGVIYGKDNIMDSNEFYNRMDEGATPTTMATNPEEDYNQFKKLLDEGYDILHIAFSSALSSSFNNVSVVANNLREEYPDQKIIIIDSLSASLGEGQLVYKACEFKKAGKDIDEIAKIIEEYIPYSCHQFTVSDLNALYRGGRVSKTTAFLGTLANIKPILHCSDEGKLVAIAKVRGRKKSLDTLVDNMEERMGRFKSENDVVFLGCGNCTEDVEYIENLIKERFGCKVITNMVCPTVGAHTGSSVIALFFIGEKR